MTFDAGTPHGVLIELGAALALLVGSVVIAGDGDASADLMIAIWGTLLLIWAIHHFSS